MIDKKLSQIDAADIQSLIDNQVSESRTIEYKLNMPSGTDEDKREFLADVSSFANGAGGDLLYGVEADDGKPTAARGLDGFNEDQERLRLEACLRDGIKPRLPSVHLHVVGFPEGPVLVVRVTRSWRSPHMVVFKGSSRFYTRSSAGKYPMDVDELRAAFVQSEEFPERVRNWRDDRLAKIIGDETPARLVAGSRLALHIVPVSLGQTPLDIQRIREAHFPPLGKNGWDHRINLDGVVTYSGVRPNYDAYCQVDRLGRVEAVRCEFVERRNSQRLVDPGWHEPMLTESVRAYLGQLTTLGVPPPFVILVAATGTKGAYISMRNQAVHGSSTIDHDPLILPEVIAEDESPDVPQLLKPVFDAIWNAGGYPRSPNYDEEGNWKPRSA